MFLPLNCSKRKFVTNPKALSDFVRQPLRECGIVEADSAPFMVLDISLGSNTGGHGLCFRNRLHIFARRKQRIVRVGKAGGPASRILQSGIRPSVLYLAHVYGVSQSAVSQLRSSSGTALPFWRKGCSTTLALAMAPVKFLGPLYEATLAPVMEWSKNVSSGYVSPLQCMKVCECYEETFPAATDLWVVVEGPTGAFILASARAGSTVQSCIRTSVCDRSYDLSATPPCVIRRLAMQSVQKSIDTHIARSLDCVELEEGVVWHPVESLVRPRAKKGERSGRSFRLWGILRYVLINGTWDPSRKYEAGYLESPKCNRCGANRDNLWHRCVSCTEPSVEELRASLSPETIEFMHSFSESHSLFKVGLLPSYHGDVPGVSEIAEEHSVGSSLYRFEHFIFWDGAGCEPKHPLLRRCGFVVICTSSEGELIRGVYGYLPSSNQTGPRAEAYALLRGLKLSEGGGGHFVFV